MKNFNKTKIGLIIIIVFLFFFALIFFIKWNASTAMSRSYNDFDKKFDSIYNSNDGFKKNVAFLQRTMLFKVIRVKNAIEKHDFEKEEDLIIAKSIMDSLKFYLNIEERNINEVVRNNTKSNDTLNIFSEVWIEKIKTIKLNDGKEPFVLILDTLEQKIKHIKK